MSGCPDKRTDRDGTRISGAAAVDLPWRVGTQVGRTIYARDEITGWERLIGCAITVELAEQVVAEHAAWRAARMPGAYGPRVSQYGPGGNRWMQAGPFRVQLAAATGDPEEPWTRVAEMDTADLAAAVAEAHNLPPPTNPRPPTVGR